MARKLFGALVLAFCVMLLTMVLASADTPTPGDQPRGKPATPPGLQKTPEPEKNKEKEKGPHAVFGVVTSKGVSEFKVTTKKGDAVIVKVTSNTRFQIPTKKEAGFSDLNVGDSVAVNGTPTPTGLEAKKVGIVPGKPSVQHRVGVVTAFSANSVTIKDVRGNEATFQLTKDVEIRNPKGDGVKVGDRVTVVSQRDPSTSVFTARAIVVHPN